MGQPKSIGPEPLAWRRGRAYEDGGVDGWTHEPQRCRQARFFYPAVASAGTGLRIGGDVKRQIADKLGYKNGHSVATIVYEIAKQLGVEGVYSRTEKRQFTADAYRQAKRNVSKSLSLDVGKLEDDRAIPIRGPSGSKLRALLRQGYEVERVEVILRLRTGG